MINLQPVSIISVTRDGYFFSRLLVERIRALIGVRPYEIIIVDRGSKDATRRWMSQQPDVNLIKFAQWRTRGHGHAESAKKGIKAARYPNIVLLDSDAHPIAADWLENSVDSLNDSVRLSGAKFVDKHIGNPHGWYVHPHFMCFKKADVGNLIELRKLLGDDTDTGEEATIRVLGAGYEIRAFPIEFCLDFSVGHPRVPTVSNGVFHAWYVSRLEHEEANVIRETSGVVTRESYLIPLQNKLRAAYGLDY
ncbi:MAG: glycosyltransferase [Methylococcaceae bacterium]|jgi:glycosyltransferase involved in cell wall biosynthesis